jgi:hypothetical protein
MINLHYIRAAIEANTGIRLSLAEVRTYLLEEGLITPKQADEDAKTFTGYGEMYTFDDASRSVEEFDQNMGLPDTYIPS